nr:hypothetical protein [Tanacetum cinerariifolium]
ESTLGREDTGNLAQIAETLAAALTDLISPDKYMSLPFKRKTSKKLQEVILNRDSPVPTRVVEGVLQPVAPTTAKQMLAQKNELKARGTLLMALPDKH